MAFQKAQRKKVKLKLGLFGPSGSGKTASALLLAKGLVGDWSKVAVLDTENDSASLYANNKRLGIGEFMASTLTPPFSPDRYREVINEAFEAGFEVLVIDSVTHEWSGPGGILDMKTNMTGNDFAKWATLTPLHNQFWSTILQVPMHIIVTGRTKEEYNMVTGSGGRLKVEKAGTNIIQRDGVEYELTTAFTLDIKHNATSSKDRTGMFMDIPPFQITEETGKKFIERTNLGLDQEADEATSEQTSDEGPGTSEEV